MVSGAGQLGPVAGACGCVATAVRAVRANRRPPPRKAMFRSGTTDGHTQREWQQPILGERGCCGTQRLCPPRLSLSQAITKKQKKGQVRDVDTRRGGDRENARPTPEPTKTKRLRLQRMQQTLTANIDSEQQEQTGARGTGEQALAH